MMKDNISNKHIIIFGSSRSDGNTRKIIDEIIRDHSLTFIDLNDFEITPFDYEHKNKGDDFIPLIEKIMNYDTMIIATPVYWYQIFVPTLHCKVTLLSQWISLTLLVLLNSLMEKRMF
jgi:hypothetical protein